MFRAVESDGREVMVPFFQFETTFANSNVLNVSITPSKMPSSSISTFQLDWSEFIVSDMPLENWQVICSLFCCGYFSTLVGQMMQAFFSDEDYLNYRFLKSESKLESASRDGTERFKNFLVHPSSRDKLLFMRSKYRLRCRH